jgi:hypothetical protein
MRKGIFSLPEVLTGNSLSFPITEENTVTGANPTKNGSYVEAVFGNMSFIKLKSIKDHIELKPCCGLAIYVTEWRQIVLATAPGDEYSAWLSRNSAVSNPQNGIYVAVFEDKVWTNLKKFVESCSESTLQQYAPEPAPKPVVPAPMPQIEESDPAPQQKSSDPVPSDSGNAVEVRKTAPVVPNEPRDLDDLVKEIADARRDVDIDIPIDGSPMPASITSMRDVRQATQNESIVASRREVQVPDEAKEKGPAARVASRLVGILPKKKSDSVRRSEQRHPVSTPVTTSVPAVSSDDWADLYD